MFNILSSPTHETRRKQGAGGRAGVVTKRVVARSRSRSNPKEARGVATGLMPCLPDPSQVLVSHTCCPLRNVTFMLSIVLASCQRRPAGLLPAVRAACVRQVPAGPTNLEPRRVLDVLDVLE